MRKSIYRIIKFIQAEAVVSKYIGEREKNMDLIFVEEEEAHVILLFDEADAFFSKGCEMQYTNDR